VQVIGENHVFGAGDRLEVDLDDESSFSGQPWRLGLWIHPLTTGTLGIRIQVEPTRHVGR